MKTTLADLVKDEPFLVNKKEPTTGPFPKRVFYIVLKHEDGERLDKEPTILDFAFGDEGEQTYEDLLEKYGKLDAPNVIIYEVSNGTICNSYSSKRELADKIVSKRIIIEDKPGGFTWYSDVRVFPTPFKVVIPMPWYKRILKIRLTM